MGIDRFAGLTSLSQFLWREREQLELLVFRLQAQRLLLVRCDTRWLSHASRDVESVLDRLAEFELHRAVALSAASAEVGLGLDGGLRALAEAAPPPWPSVIDRHHAALRRLTTEVLSLAEANQGLLEEGLEEVESPVVASRRPAARALIDTAAYHAALSVNARVLHPSLVDLVDS